MLCSTLKGRKQLWRERNDAPNFEGRAISVRALERSDAPSERNDAPRHIYKDASFFLR